jgi:WD40 repeat protein
MNRSGRPQLPLLALTAARQVGSFWLGEFMGSVSLTGDINYLDERSGVAPVKVVQGHQKTATAMACAPGGDVYTASYDGVVNRWQPTRAGCTGRVLGKGHGGAGVTGLTPCGDHLLSFGLDDQVLRARARTHTHTHKSYTALYLSFVRWQHASRVS